MGLIVAAFDAISGNLGDQWLDVIEAADMEEGIVMTKGVSVRRGEKRNNNRKDSSDIVSNGSIIHVNQNQFMMLVDGGKIVDYSAEPGYFKVDNSSMPSLFNGEFKDSLIDAWNRFKFSGTPSQKQEVYFINLQEIKGIKFGTPNPLNYFDNFYNAELFVRSFGNYSIKITDPIKFFQEVCPRNTAQVHINDVNEQYLSEFLEALQASINQMSIDGTRISHLPSKGRELSQFMAQTLDDLWKEIRGMEVLSVGIASISYDDESKEIINMRNKGAVLTDPVIREGFVQGSIARGMEAAGSNEAGAGTSFMGMGIGMAAGGGFMGQSSQTNLQQMQMQQQQAQARQQATANEWQCTCGAKNSGKFCGSCGTQKPENNKCSQCGTALPQNAKFCTECGTKVTTASVCGKCGASVAAGAKFCNECGEKLG